jgi:hypothetical protein
MRAPVVNQAGDRNGMLALCPANIYRVGLGIAGGFANARAQRVTLATVVRTAEVETVEGKTHRYRNPCRSALGSEGHMMLVNSWNAKPVIGNGGR